MQVNMYNVLQMRSVNVVDFAILIGISIILRHLPSVPVCIGHNIIYSNSLTFCLEITKKYSIFCEWFWFAPWYFNVLSILAPERIFPQQILCLKFRSVIKFNLCKYIAVTEHFCGTAYILFKYVYITVY